MTGRKRSGQDGAEDAKAENTQNAQANGDQPPAETQAQGDGGFVRGQLPRKAGSYTEHPDGTLEIRKEDQS